MTKIALTLISATALIALSGCSAPGACDARDDYQSVRSIGQIEVPENLDALPESARLEIPVSSTPPDVEKRCLEKPPKFSQAVSDGD